MHYRLIHSLDKIQAGTEDDQCLAYESILKEDDPRRIFNYLMKPVPSEQAIEAPRPILIKKAKLTDLIKTAFGNSLWLIMSDKLKSIICSKGYDGIQLFPTSVFKNDINIPGYWISHASGFRYEYIDFTKSECSLRGLGDTRLASVKINDSHHFKTYREQLEWPNRLGIDTLRLIPDIPEDFFILAYIDGGIGYFVSEKLKSEIETAGCTGVAFIPAEMKISEFLDERLKNKTANDIEKMSKQLSDAGLSPEQQQWLLLKGSRKEVTFIMQTWGEERRYEPEKSDIALRISLDAWRLGFLDTWNEEILDAILEKQLDKTDLAYADAFKEHLQLQILLARREFKKESYFRSFLRALLDTLVNGFELNMLQPLDGEKIYDSADEHIYIFKKHWPEGSLVKLSKHDGDELPDSVVMVIGE